MNLRERPDADLVTDAWLYDLRLADVEQEWAALVGYQSTIEEHVMSLTAESVAGIEEYCRANGLSERDRRAVWSVWGDVLSDKELYYWSVLDSAFVMKTCAWLESSLALVCRSLDRDERVAKDRRWSSINDRGLAKARTYLRSNFELDLARHRSWSQLKQILKVRNCIVHAGGRPSLMGDVEGTGRDHRAETLAAVRQLNGVDLCGDDEICFDKDFFSALFELVGGFWRDTRSSLSRNHIVGPVVAPIRGESQESSGEGDH